MARFTVADCMETITNRFDMTLAAAFRARQINNGSETLLPKSSINNDKATVLALREVAADLIDTSILKNIE
ncbi:MAG: DNA-directed RNA polymerase subunit omega [Proteobacteria bacterium]|jgi:DNA-directed RNA polymerase subunit omega|nr:DNA-directed RNA polymerase subunit omega [Pseudomonadota bacterium]